MKKIIKIAIGVAIGIIIVNVLGFLFNLLLLRAFFGAM